jgi:uncharacterized protein YggE
VGSPQFSLLDRRAAYEEALAAAIKVALSQAQVVAAASRLRIAGVKQIQVGQPPAGSQTPATGPLLRPSPNRSATVTDLRPPPIEVRASVTVIYLLKP